MCRGGGKINTSVLFVPRRCWTKEGLSLFQDQRRCPGPDMDGHSVPGPCVEWWCLPLMTHAWTWRGWAAVSGEDIAHELQLMSSQDVMLLLSQLCSVFSLDKWTLKFDMTDDISHFHTSKLCFIFAEPSLMSWTWARQRSFMLAPRCCHQPLVPVDCVRDSQIYLWCLSSVLHDKGCIFLIPVL